MSNNRIRVLLIAEAANPEWVSVPLVGWSHYRAISEITDSHLVTHVRNADAIERAGLTRSHFTAIDSERISRFFWRVGNVLRGGAGKGWTTVMALNAISYYYFEHLVWRRFESDLRAGKFDIVHRVTPLSPTVPSLLASKCKRVGIPFVVGPLNGGVPWPMQFDKARRAEREWLSYVRGVHKRLPGYRSTRRDASVIIIGSRDSWKQMPAEYLDRCIYIPENGVSEAQISAPRVRPPGDPIRAAFVGRLVPYKGADMLLEAAAPLIRSRQLVLTIVGDGPQRAELDQIIQRERLSGGVTLKGWVDYAGVQKILADTDLLTFPSIREFGGGVALEAMAAGALPIVVDYGGLGELVTASTGVLVDLAERSTLIKSFRAELTRAIADPSSIMSRSRNAQVRVRNYFTWEAKARQVLEVYRWILRHRDSKPDWGMPIGVPEPGIAQ